MKPFRTALYIAFLLIAATIAADYVIAGCDSTFHKTFIIAHVRNPPVKAVEIARVQGTPRHYQIDCFLLYQAFPALEGCANTGTNTKLYLCHQDVAKNELIDSDWTCIDVTTYLSSQFYTLIVGSSSGPELRIRFTWKPALTRPECYPRDLSVFFVGLDVPEPGTRSAASWVFVGIVLALGLVVVVFGAYMLWRVSKRFEHRLDSQESPRKREEANSAQRRYRQALKAIGADKDLVKNGFYDDQEEDEEGEEGFDEEYEEGAEDLDYDEEYYDEEEEGEYYDHDEKQQVDQEEKDVVVLDNNQVLRSEAKPVPWYEKEKGKNNNNSKNNAGLVDSPGGNSQRGNNNENNDASFTSTNQRQRQQDPSSSRAARYAVNNATQR